MGGIGQYGVGFLYTPIVKVPSTSGLMMVSRKGMEPSSFASSTVNWMDGSTVLDELEELFLMCLMLQHKGIIYIPFPYPGGCCAVVMALFSKASMNMFAMIGLMGDSMAVPFVCS